MYSLKRKKSTRKCKVEDRSSSAQGDKKFKEKPDAKWNNSDLGVRLHPANFPTCKKELKERLKQ